MSLTHPDLIEEDSRNGGEVTDNYTHPGWNLRQRRLMLSVGVAIGLLLSLKTCEKQPDDGEQVPTRIVPESSQLQ